MDLSRIIFSDETSVTCSEASTNSRSRRAWVPSNVKAEDLPADVIAKPTSHFSVKVMGHVCISKIGPLPVVLCGPGCKVNQQKYREMMELDIVPNIIEVEPDLSKVWRQEDNARAHSAKKMRAWLAENPPTSSSGLHSHPISHHSITASTIALSENYAPSYHQYQSRKLYVRFLKKWCGRYQGA